MPVTHPVDVMRIEPALPTPFLIAVTMMVVSDSPQRDAHHSHYEWPQQISHYRFSHETLRRGRDRYHRRWLYFRR
jgi:hypothetical protein